MTLGGVRAFFRGRLEALGFNEWPDGFNTENIPSTVLDNSFHIEVGTIEPSSNGQTNYYFSMPLVVRLFFKGFRDPSTKIDEALDSTQSVLADFLDSTVRNTQNDLKDIRPVSVKILPLAESNDNAVISEIVLEAFLIYCF